MKERKLLGREILASLLFLLGFFLIRFALKSFETNMGGDTLAPILTVAVFLIAVMIYLSGEEKRFLSFSFDALVLAVVGYFLWELKGIEAYSLWFGLAAFALFVIISVVNTIRMIQVSVDGSKGVNKLVPEAHSLITYGLATKVVVTGLGAIAVEKLLLPMLAS